MDKSKGFYSIVKMCLDAVKDSSYKFLFFNFEGTISGKYKDRLVEAGNSQIFCEYTTPEIKEPVDYVIRLQTKKEITQSSPGKIKVGEHIYKDTANGFLVYLFKARKEFFKEEIIQVLDKLISIEKEEGF
jgi:hypothetical protein